MAKPGAPLGYPVATYNICPSFLAVLPLPPPQGTAERRKWDVANVRWIIRLHKMTRRA